MMSPLMGRDGAVTVTSRTVACPASNGVPKGSKGFGRVSKGLRRRDKGQTRSRKKVKPVAVLT